MRHVLRTPAEGCVVEQEDVWQALTGAHVMAPRSDNEFMTCLAAAPRDADTLVLCMLHLGQLDAALSRLKGWRQRYRRVIAYVFDGFLGPHTKGRRSWASRWWGRHRRFAQIDRLYTPVPQALPELSSAYGIPVDVLPLAIDMARFASTRAHRVIDVMAYGRQHAQHVAALKSHFNRPTSEGLLYGTQHMPAGPVPDLEASRAHFWTLLIRSRVALAYDLVKVSSGKRRIPYSFVGQRWFESLAAGCVVAGYRPTGPDADALLAWPGATVELPEDTGAMVAAVEALLADDAALARQRLRNVGEMAARHDWGRRIALILHDGGVHEYDAAIEARQAALEARFPLAPSLRSRETADAVPGAGQQT